MYSRALTEAMEMLSLDRRTIFVGQAVAYDGQAAFRTFAKVPMGKRLEMPVVEDFQMGFCTGLSLVGLIPVCFYPRMDFLIIAANQLLNHLDKIPLMGAFRPKVIIRVAVGRSTPLDPGPQHVQDYAHALDAMLHTVRVVTLEDAHAVKRRYREALESKHSTILVERMSLYDL